MLEVTQASTLLLASQYRGILTTTSMVSDSVEGEYTFIKGGNAVGRLYFIVGASYESTNSWWDFSASWLESPFEVRDISGVRLIRR
jgi:hypothetical protein